MIIENQDVRDFRRIQAEVLRQAATIAEAEASPLAVEYWNGACQRIAQRLEAQAARLEAEVVESSAVPKCVSHLRHPSRPLTTRCPGRPRL